MPTRRTGRLRSVVVRSRSHDPGRFSETPGAACHHYADAREQSSHARRPHGLRTSKHQRSLPRLLLAGRQIARYQTPPGQTLARPSTALVPATIGSIEEGSPLAFRSAGELNRRDRTARSRMPEVPGGPDTAKARPDPAVGAGRRAAGHLFSHRHEKRWWGLWASRSDRMTEIQCRNR